MSEEIKTTASQEQFEEVMPNAPLLENTEETIETNQSEDLLQDLSSKSLKDIVTVFQEVVERGDSQEMYKYAEPIKAIFYKTLKREKIAAGYVEPVESEVVAEDEAPAVSENPFAEVENAFKDVFSKYKVARASHLQELEQKKDENLVVKQGIIEELKSLLETQEDINTTFPKFRTLQTRWRESGPVPQNKVKDTYETYQHYVELFYDYVKINNELRDLDFKKNLEAKTALCEAAEKLAEEENVVNAFAKLQKLHDEWKEFGPVEKEYRDAIWDRFKAATSQVNKKHQAHFEKVKVEQKENLAAKSILCEKAEAIASREIDSSNGWNDASKELDALQKEWKGIGFASKKENQKIYDRFRAACDQFYNRKREYYSQFKDQMTRNMEKKIELCEKAEAMKESTDWKKTTEDLIELQRIWKETGPVSRKKSEQIWNRFRAACDYFFDNKEKNYGGIDPEYVENLNKKLALIEEIKEYESEGNDSEAMRDFVQRWNEIGFVPIKEKDKVQAMYKEALDAKFQGLSRAKRYGKDNRGRKETNPLKTEREKLVQKFRKKESEIATYENNMGFFASSKNAEPLIKEILKKIEAAKTELEELEAKIKEIDNQFE